MRPQKFIPPMYASARSKLKRVWKHTRYPSAQFIGGYERDIDGERVFTLINIKSGRKVTFESPLMAKRLGWENTIISKKEVI